MSVSVSASVHDFTPRKLGKGNWGNLRILGLGGGRGVSPPGNLGRTETRVSELVFLKLSLRQRNIDEGLKNFVFRDDSCTTKTPQNSLAVSKKAVERTREAHATRHPEPTASSSYGITHAMRGRTGVTTVPNSLHRRVAHVEKKKDTSASRKFHSMCDAVSAHGDGSS